MWSLRRSSAGVWLVLSPGPAALGAWRAPSPAATARGAEARAADGTGHGRQEPGLEPWLAPPQASRAPSGRPLSGAHTRPQPPGELAQDAQSELSWSQFPRSPTTNILCLSGILQGVGQIFSFKPLKQEGLITFPLCPGHCHVLFSKVRVLAPLLLQTQSKRHRCPFLLS